MNDTLAAQIPYFKVPYFSDEDEPQQISADWKAQLFLNWDYFIRSGFENHTFTLGLYHFLIHQCSFSSTHSHQLFWQHYFDHSLPAFRAILHQFGGDRYCAENPGTIWLHQGAPCSDLKLAMCDRLTQVYAPINTVLNDLEQNHQQMVRMWLDFAQHNQVETETVPGEYYITENTHRLLEFCISIALEQTAKPPVLQQVMPFTIPGLRLNGSENNEKAHLFQEGVVV